MWNVKNSVSTKKDQQKAIPHTKNLKNLQPGEAGTLHLSQALRTCKGLHTSLEISEAGEVLLLFLVSEGSNQLDFKVFFTADQTNVFQ